MVNGISETYLTLQLLALEAVFAVVVVVSYLVYSKRKRKDRETEVEVSDLLKEVLKEKNK